MTKLTVEMNGERVVLPVWVETNKYNLGFEFEVGTPIKDD